MIAATERRLDDQIICYRPKVKVTEPNPELLAVNPLNKIPSFQLDDGSSLFDSAVICAYLDTLGSERPLSFRKAPRDGLCFAGRPWEMGCPMC